MGLRYLLLVVLAINLVVRIEAGSTGQDRSPVKRMLRKETRFTENTKPPTEAEEERFGAGDAANMLWKGVSMKNKMKYWLSKGRTPEKFLDKYNILTANDDKYKYFSTYFFKYYGKNPSARPSDLPPRDTHDIIMTRITYWLKNGITPPQAEAMLSRLGRQGQEYSDMYRQMFGQLQQRLNGV